MREKIIVFNAADVKKIVIHFKNIKNIFIAHCSSGIMCKTKRLPLILCWTIKSGYKNRQLANLYYHLYLIYKTLMILYFCIFFTLCFDARPFTLIPFTKKCEITSSESSHHNKSLTLQNTF